MLHVCVAIYNECICNCIDTVVIERYVEIVLQLYSGVVVIEKAKKPKFVIVGHIVLRLLLQLQPKFELQTVAILKTQICIANCCNSFVLQF